MKEYDLVQLLHPVAGSSLAAGEMGTVIMVYPPLSNTPQAYEVEFSDSRGMTHALLTLTAEDIVPTTPAEVLQRRLASEAAPCPGSQPVPNSAYQEFRFRNCETAVLRIYLEPWGEEIRLEAGQSVELSLKGREGDPVLVEQYSEHTKIWAGDCRYWRYLG